MNTDERPRAGTGDTGVVETVPDPRRVAAAPGDAAPSTPNSPAAPALSWVDADGIAARTGAVATVDPAARALLALSLIHI